VEARKALGLRNDHRTWLEYLRDTRTVGRTGTLGKDSPAFTLQREKAQQTIDPLLTSRSIYDNSQLVDQDYSTGFQSQSMDSMITAVLEEFKLNDRSSPVYWFAKGMILANNPSIPIRCDGSAALAFYYLCIDNCFTATIGLVKQGNPKTQGHWFLVAGVAEDLRTENVSSLQDVASGRDRTRSWCFVIDLWEAMFQGAASTIAYPAACVAMDLPIEIVWKA
jgi:hypothetical protein